MEKLQILGWMSYHNIWFVGQKNANFVVKRVSELKFCGKKVSQLKFCVKKVSQLKFCGEKTSFSENLRWIIF